MDMESVNLARKKAKAYTDTKFAQIPKGIVWKGEVDYYSSLPASPSEGDAYTVRYTGTSGTNPSGVEYAWGKDQSTSLYKWIELGSVKVEEYATKLDMPETGEAGKLYIVRSLNVIFRWDISQTPPSFVEVAATDAGDIWYDASEVYSGTTIGAAVQGKQDTISDLSTIRSGAAAGATALQSVPSTYRTSAAQDTIDAGKENAQPHPYAYDGVDLKTYFGTAAALHNALDAEDYSHIHNGDYYPITFSGTYRDYGDWVALAGTTYYSDAACTVAAGELASNTVVTYVDASPAYYDITVSGTTYHVKMQDCQRWREKTINADAKMEANINVYWRYGDSGTLSNAKPHIMWLARDGITTAKMRSSNLQWADATEQFATGDGTTATYTPDDATLKCVRYVCVDGALQTYNTAYTINASTGAVTFKSSYIPANGAAILISRTTHDSQWLGSAIYKTLNDADYGLMRLITDAEFSSYILGGNGMRYFGETRTVSGSTSVGSFKRGSGFLPTEAEVWGNEIYSTRGTYAYLPQLPIFAAGGRRHISKGASAGGSRNNWWVASSYSALYVCYVTSNGFANYSNARYASALVPGFITLKP